MKKALLALTLVLAIPLAAQATPITLAGSTGAGTLSASVTFADIGANLLTVTLTNTSTFDVLNPSQVLTGVFFDTGVTLAPISASLAPGSTVFFGPDGGGNVGGEWAFRCGLCGAPGGATQGISSAGLGLFGAANFNGPNLQGPVAVGGLQYGLTSAGDNTATGNTPVTGKFALIQNSVVFTLAYSGTLDLNDVSHVAFQYGTSLGEVPTPDGGMTITLLGLAFAGMGLLARRKK